MTRYSGQYTDEYGRPIVGGQVYVYDPLLALATLTETEGGAPLANPVITDDWGNWFFYTSGGVGRLDFWVTGKKRYSEVTTLIDSDGAIRADLASNSGASMIGTSDGDTVQEKIDLLVPLVLSAPLTPFTVIPPAQGNGSTDDLPAFDAVITALAAGMARRAYFPGANYALNGTWEIKGGRFRLEGDSTGQAADSGEVGGTRLIFPANTCGVRLHRHNTMTNTTSASGVGADGTMFDGFELIGGGGAAVKENAGMWYRCRGKPMNSTIRGFGGPGLMVLAQQGGGGDQEGNANNMVFDTLRIIQNGLHGVYLEGADANAYFALMIDASNNTGRGILESSFLGGFLHHHAEGNTLGPWKVEDNNAMTWMLGYTEPGVPDSEAAAGTIAIGQQFVTVAGSGTFLRAAGLAGGGLNPSNGVVVSAVAGAYEPNIGMGRSGKYLDMKGAAGGQYNLAENAGAVNFDYASINDIWRAYGAGGGVLRIYKPMMPNVPATAVGTLNGKFPVHDAAGAVVGYVPIYATIT